MKASYAENSNDLYDGDEEAEGEDDCQNDLFPRSVRVHARIGAWEPFAHLLFPMEFESPENRQREDDNDQVEADAGSYIASSDFTILWSIVKAQIYLQELFPVSSYRQSLCLLWTELADWHTIIRLHRVDTPAGNQLIPLFRDLVISVS